MAPAGRRSHKELTGVDIFLHWSGGDIDALAARLQSTQHGTGLALEVITNRGVRVWPHGFPETFCVDHWRCRFRGEQPASISPVELQRKLIEAGLDVVKTENLYLFDGQPGFSAVHG
jgi:isocitrate dehydrogenase